LCYYSASSAAALSDISQISASCKAVGTIKLKVHPTVPLSANLLTQNGRLAPDSSKSHIEKTARKCTHHKSKRQSIIYDAMTYLLLVHIRTSAISPVPLRPVAALKIHATHFVLLIDQSFQVIYHHRVNSHLNLSEMLISEVTEERFLKEATMCSLAGFFYQSRLIDSSVLYSLYMLS